jgi:uncharacterized membrane protein
MYSRVDGARCWRMRRNCALTPAQTLVGFAALCALILPIGALWWLLGYPLVMVFVLAELLTVAVLLCCYARHAVDAETLLLHDGRLQVRQDIGTRFQVTEFDVPSLRVRLMPDPSQFVALRARGTQVLVGRYLTGPQRQQLARELQQALNAHGGS